MLLWLINPISFSLLPGLAPMFWSRARELEETPRVGCRRATGFSVPVFLLLLLCRTGARTTSMHRTCVIPRRRCSCGAGVHRQVQLHDLEVGFRCLHRQRSCGNIPAHSIFKGMNTTTTPLPFNYIDRSWEKGLLEKNVFCCEPNKIAATQDQLRLSTGKGDSICSSHSGAARHTDKLAPRPSITHEATMTTPTFASLSR
jgi:hypothetical protein